jgi:DNA-binding XRE family transcriptional regulator
MNDEVSYGEVGYAKLASLVGTATTLCATFQDGGIATLVGDRMLPSDLKGKADWTTVRFDPDDPYELVVDTELGPIELPAERIRLLTDDAFAAFIRHRESLLGPPGPIAPGLMLRRIRLDRGLTRQELAERAGVSPRTLARIERGRHDPKLSTIRALLDALESKWADLDDPTFTKRTNRPRSTKAA